MRGSVWVALFAASLGALTACTSYRVAPADVITPTGTDVRVQFSAPTAVVLRTATGDSLPQNGVTELRGALVAHSADTISMSVSQTARVEPPGTSIIRRFQSGVSIRFELPEGAALLTRQFSIGRSIAAGAISIFFLGAVLVADAPNCPGGSFIC